MRDTDVAFIFILAAAFVAGIVGVSLYIYYGRLYLRTRLAGAPVPLLRIVRLSLKGVDAYKVVGAYVDAKLAGIDAPLDVLEGHALARGNVRKVVNAVVAAKQAGLGLTLEEARTWDLRGKDPMEALERPI